MFARVTGQKQKIEAEIAKAQRTRMERDRIEWEQLETRQTEQREKMVSDIQRVFGQERLLFRAEAKRIHESLLSPQRDRSNVKDLEKEREEDDGRDGFDGPSGPGVRLGPPGR